MTSTELATVTTGTLTLSGEQVDWTPVQRAALDHLGIAAAPQGDQQVFLHVAQRMRLDPFGKQIYMIGRREKGEDGEYRIKWTIQTGIDGFRITAERHPQYAGTLDPEWCGPDGAWRDSWTAQTPPVMARVKVLRHDRQHPIALPVLFNEFAARFRDGNLQGQWRTKPAHMIAKVAEAAALRKAFPQDLSGVFTDDEMAHVDNPGQSRTFDHAGAAGPSVAELTGSPVVVPSDDEIEVAIGRGDVAELRALWQRTLDVQVRERIAAAVRTAQHAETTTAPVDAEIVDDPAEGGTLADQTQRNHMHALWGKAGVSRDERLAVTAHLIGHEITTSNEITVDEANLIIERLRAFETVGKDALVAQVDRWLGDYAAQNGAES